MNVVYNMDCMVGMAEYPDKFFDLAVVDPPYGINRFKKRKPSLLGKHGAVDIANDPRPDEAYIKELFRVSKQQIVWGFNHLCDLLPPCTAFVFWYKHQPLDTFSDGELAWTSFPGIAKCFDYAYFGVHGADTERIHPMQKPVALYDWIFKQYAEPGCRILDTHVGSGSSRIAAYDAALDFVGFEIDKTYFAKQEDRFLRHSSQINLFLDTGG